ETLRSYGFTYAPGAFHTDVLEKITHYDNADNEFASHTLDYYDDVDSRNGYKPFKNGTETWNLHDDGIEAGFVNPVAALGVDGFSDRASALGGSKTTTTAMSTEVGIGPFNADLTTKSGTVGGSVSYSSSTTRGLSTLVDINGDGLPDKVYQKDSRLYYRPNIARQSATETKYGEETEIPGIREFSTSTSSTTGYGVNTNVGYYALTAVAGENWSKTRTRTTVYFSDVNNDGLVDVVRNGVVYFNHIKQVNGKAVPEFTTNSGDTPSPISGGGEIDDSDTQVSASEQAEVISNSPLQDVVRVWEAPRSGTVKIEGDVQLQAPEAGYDADEYAKADGVRVAIQVRGDEKWSQLSAKDDFTSFTPAGVSSLAVNRGDRVYFRLQSGTTDMANGSFDRVSWSPVITYTGTGEKESIDPDGYSTVSYPASEGDLRGEDRILRLLQAADFQITGHFEKPVTSDSIALEVLLANGQFLDDGVTQNPAYQEQTVFRRVFGKDETHCGDLNISVNNSIAGNNIRFRIVAETAVAWEKIRWTPYVEYISEGTGRKEQAIASYSLYASLLRTGQPYAMSGDAVNISVRPELPVFSPFPLAPLSGQVLLAVKGRNCGLLAKKVIHIINDTIPKNDTIALTGIPRDSLWLEYYVSDKALMERILSYSAIVTENATETTVYANTLTERAYDGFGPGHRGWGQFVYNAAEGRAALPVNENLLQLPQSENDNTDPRTQVFVPMTLNSQPEPAWRGGQENCYMDGNSMSCARLSVQDVLLTNPLSGLGSLSGTGAFGPVLETKTSGKAFMTGAAGITYSDSDGETQTGLSFMDMNGDGYPDIVSGNMIQLTGSQGGFEGEKLTGVGMPLNSSDSYSWGLGGNPVHAIATTMKGMGIIKENRASNEAQTATANASNMKVSGSGSLPRGNDRAEEAFLDINGDGLPDKILSNKQVRINLGYGFSEAAEWELSEIQKGSNETVNMSLGFSYGSTISGGFGLTTTTSGTDYCLMDINADGLPDKVWAENGLVKVAMNTGSSFATQTLWNGLNRIDRSASTAESLNAAFGVNIMIPIPFFPLKLSISPGTNIGRSMSRERQALRDVDGDGFPDIVSSDEDGKMSVIRSAIARTNRLKTVYNP
ncbi:MAG: type IV secretion protein Rhs, partial [Tannerella sp.]|nr:type IV secretion protein Rhs [Tannerella sp.]